MKSSKSKKKGLTLLAAPCIVAAGVGGYFYLPEIIGKEAQAEAPLSQSKPILEQRPKLSAKQSSISSDTAAQERLLQSALSEPAVTLPDIGELTADNALEMLEELKQDPQTWREQKALFFQAWGKVDAEKAISYARTHGGSSASALVGQGVKGWAAIDAEAAQQWVLQQKEGREKILFGKLLLAEMKEASWDEKSGWILKFAEGPHGHTVARAFSKNWALESPTEAISWAANLSEDTARQSSLKSVIQTWVDQDSEAAGNYLNEMAKGQERDEVVSYFVTRVASFDKESARAWAETISNPTLQAATLKRL